MDPTDKDCLKQLDSLLFSDSQSWLFGAGISKVANIPLMTPLTNRIFAKAADSSDKNIKSVLDTVKSELPDNAHIEHILSHLGDIATLAERSKSRKAKVGSLSLEIDVLRDLHAIILQWIAETIRWGYVETPELIGSRENPIVTVDAHNKFICTLFNCNQAGVADRRGAVRMFTINYDTLLEDALSLGSRIGMDFLVGLLHSASTYTAKMSQSQDSEHI
jgi:hypothetical protein